MKIFKSCNYQKTIKVFGTATIEIVPDYIEWNFNINVIESSLEKSDEKLNKNIESFINTLTEYNIVQNDYSISLIEHGKNMVYKDRIYIQEGFYSIVKIIFKIKDIKNYKKIISELLKYDNITNVNTEFKSTKLIETRKKARTEALLQAKIKASEMSKVFNMNIDKPLKIIENVSETYFTRDLSSNYVSTTKDSNDFVNIKVKESVEVLFLMK